MSKHIHAKSVSALELSSAFILEDFWVIFIEILSTAQNKSSALTDFQARPKPSSGLDELSVYRSVCLPIGAAHTLLSLALTLPQASRPLAKAKASELVTCLVYFSSA